MSRAEILRSHASVVTTEQLCHWIQQLKARALTDVTAERLEIFLAELASRAQQYCI